ELESQALAGEELRALASAAERRAEQAEQAERAARQRLAELEGRELPEEEGPTFDEVDYEKLKRRHNSLVREVDALEKRLVKRGVYGELRELAEKGLGLDVENFSNLDEVTPKLLKAYKGIPEDAHQFITLLETLREKRELESQLSQYRLG
ncbi:MAG: hypothetical protein QXD04_03545, partial [Candidatus Bathyarchaeia archaeon]